MLFEKDVSDFLVLVFTRKYPPHGYILFVLTYISASNRYRFGGEKLSCDFVDEWFSMSISAEFWKGFPLP